MNISVIIPVYNAKQFLRDSVSSALKLSEVKEVILIEDGSPDGSLSICKELIAEDGRIKLFRHPGGINKGAGASRNLGIQKATQEYISFLDADDFYTEIRFKCDKKIFEDYPECEAVYGAMGTRVIDEYGAFNWNKRGLDSDHLTTVNKEIPNEELFKYFIGFLNKQNYSGYFHIATFTVKRNRLIESGILFPIELRLHQDTVFIWKCTYYLRCYSGEILKPIAIRTVHKENRFITNKNEDFTHSLMWRSVLFWSRKEKMPEALKLYIQQRYISKIRNIESRSTRLNFIFKDLINFKNSGILSIIGIKGAIRSLIKY